MSARAPASAAGAGRTGSVDLPPDAENNAPGTFRWCLFDSLAQNPDHARVEVCLSIRARAQPQFSCMFLLH